MATRTLMDEVVQTSYSQFTIETDSDQAWNGDADRFFADQVNGWVGAAVPGNLIVVLGRYGGGSAVRITSNDAEPPLGDQWEDVVEVSFEFDEFADEVRWLPWPADRSPDAIIRIGSDDAQYWHTEWGSRRAAE